MCIVVPRCNGGTSRTWVKVGLSHLTQMGVLHLLTTSAAMHGKPLILNGMWQIYDCLFEDDRVVFLPEPASLEENFRTLSTSEIDSPKVWTDGCLLAFATCYGGQLVTFDHALKNQGTGCLVLR